MLTSQAERRKLPPQKEYFYDQNVNMVLEHHKIIQNISILETNKFQVQQKTFSSFKVKERKVFARTL